MHRRFLGAIAMTLVMILVAACGPKSSSPPPGGGNVSDSVTCTDPLGCHELAKGDPIKLAYALVTAGPNASLGIDSRRGVEIAIDDKGGKLLGRDVQLVGEDTACSAEGGQAAALKLAADEKIVAIVGTTCSGEARPAAPIITKAGKVMISPSNTAPFLTAADRGSDFAGYLRTAHNDEVQGAVAAQYAYNELKIKKAATIHDGSPYSESLQRVFAEEFKRLGGTITNQEAIQPGNTDMRPVLTRIAANSPELIYFPVFTAEGGYIARQSREVAGTRNTILMAADGTFSMDFMSAAGNAADGMFMSSPDKGAFTAGYQTFLDKHSKKYGEAPLSVYHAHAYDAANMIMAAIEKVAQTDANGKTLIGKQALRDALYGTKGFPGLTGNLTCNANGDCADPVIGVYKMDSKATELPKTPVWTPAKR